MKIENISGKLNHQALPNEQVAILCYSVRVTGSGNLTLIYGLTTPNMTYAIEAPP